MAKAIQLINSDIKTTIFEDNGGEPDGNAWLAIDWDEDEVSPLLASGDARFVEVKLATVEAMARYCGFVFDADQFESRAELRDWMVDFLFPAADEKTAGWTYYSKDDRFLFIEAGNE